MNKQKFVGLALVVTAVLAGGQLLVQRGAFLLAEHDVLTVCHVPTDPDETREINAQTLDIHLGHGDYLGPCQTANSSSSSASSESISSSSSASSEVSSSSSLSSLSSEASKFIMLCHVQSGQTIEVPEHAATAHLNHGDYLGPCIASSPSSSSSSEISSSSSGPDISNVVQDNDTPRGGGGGSGMPNAAILRGHGLREHAAALDLTLQRHGLHKNAMHTYVFQHEDIHPTTFASADEQTDWILKTHAVACSMYRYLQRLRELRPGVVSGYIDWLAERLAETLEQDPVEIKAALMGYTSTYSDTTGFIRSINETSCQANPYISGIVLEEYDDAASEHPAADQIHQEYSPTGSHAILQIQEIPTEGEIVFSIMEGDEIYTQFSQSNTTAMHAIVVRDDLRYSNHIHPHRDGNGLWRMPFVPPAASTYWVFADFLDAEGHSHVLRFARTYEGNTGIYGLEENMSRIKRAGKYFVRLQETPYSDGSIITIDIRDKLGYEPLIEKSEGGYRGHGVLVSTIGGYIHVHPSPAADGIVIHIPKVETGYFRLYMEFKIQGKLYLVEFDLMFGEQ